MPPACLWASHAMLWPHAPGFAVTPSAGNFLLVELTDPNLPVAAFRQAMESEGILLRYFRTPDLARHVRVTVGTAEHTAALARVLADLRARLDAGEAHTLAQTHA